MGLTTGFATLDFAVEGVGQDQIRSQWLEIVGFLLPAFRQCAQALTDVPPRVPHILAVLILIRQSDNTRCGEGRY